MTRLEQHIQRIEFVTLWTKNLEAPRDFYTNRLGLSLVKEQTGNFFQFDICGLPVCVDYHPERSGNESNQIGVRVDDLEVTVELLRELGLRVRTGDRPDASERWASVEDPDGHELIFITDKTSKS
jgi:catechol 2,3-dioxygenase-like lactoylglutathione lyase family enzyme